jgi:hypothetical protein
MGIETIANYEKKDWNSGGQNLWKSRICKGVEHHRLIFLFVICKGFDHHWLIFLFVICKGVDHHCLIFRFVICKCFDPHCFTFPFIICKGVANYEKKD